MRPAERGWLLPLGLPSVPSWVLYAVLVAAVLLFTGWQGYRLGVAKLDAYKAQQLAKAVRIDAARTAVTERVVTKYVTQTVPQTQVVTETVEKEVIRYADRNTGLCLDGAWRVLHDDAAANRLPPPGLFADGAGRAPPRAAEALATVTENYAACHRTADRLEALQEWVRGQAGVR